MTDQEAFDTCFEGDGRGLNGRSMVAFARLLAEVLKIGGFVVEEIGAPDAFGYPMIEEGIRRIRIRPGPGRGFGNGLIFDQYPVFPEIAFPPFEPVEKGGGNIKLPGFFRVYSSEGADLPKAKAPAFDAVKDGEAAHLEFWLAEDRTFCVQGVEMER